MCKIVFDSLKYVKLNWFYLPYLNLIICFYWLFNFTLFLRGIYTIFNMLSIICWNWNEFLQIYMGLLKLVGLIWFLNKENNGSIKVKKNNKIDKWDYIQNIIFKSPYNDLSLMFSYTKIYYLWCFLQIHSVKTKFSLGKLFYSKCVIVKEVSTKIINIVSGKRYERSIADAYKGRQKMQSFTQNSNLKHEVWDLLTWPIEHTIQLFLTVCITKHGATLMVLIWEEEE